MLPNILLACAAGYLLAMALVGYVCVLGFLRVRALRSPETKVGVKILIAGHYLATMGGLISLAYIYRALRSHIPTESAIAFGIIGFVSILLAILAARQFNAEFRRLELL